LNVGNLQAGLYFIKIADGSDKWVTRFVKQ